MKPKGYISFHERDMCGDCKFLKWEEGHSVCTRVNPVFPISIDDSCDEFEQYVEDTPLTEDILLELGFSRYTMIGTGFLSISSMQPAIYYYIKGRIVINATDIWTWFLDGKQRNDIAVSTKFQLSELLKRYE